MTTISLSIEGMTCGHCVATVRKALATVPDAQDAQVGLGFATLRVPDDMQADAAEAAVRAITDAGYAATRGTTNADSLAAQNTTAGAASCCAPASEVHAIRRARP